MEEIRQNKLFVGNLPYKLGNDDLAAAFAAFGEVRSAAVIMDRATGRSKGFGFVEMAHVTDELLQSLDGAEIWGRIVTVSEARPSSEVRPRSDAESTRERSRPQQLQWHHPTRDDGRTSSFETMQDAGLDSAREPVPAEVKPMPDLMRIRVETILSGTEMAKEADRVLSGVGS